MIHRPVDDGGYLLKKYEWLLGFLNDLWVGMGGCFLVVDQPRRSTHNDLPPQPAPRQLCPIFPLPSGQADFGHRSPSGGPIFTFHKLFLGCLP